MNKAEMIEDLKYYLAQVENAEKTAKDENLDLDYVLNNIRHGLIDFAKKW